jgi:hypothetical protein
MSLQNKPILIIDQTDDEFVEELIKALVAAEAEVMAVPNVEPLWRLEKFEFSAVLIGHPPQFEQRLADAIGGLPTIFYDRSPNIIDLQPSWVTVQRDVPAILRALNYLLAAP